MKKQLVILSAVILSLAMTQISFAGLINYNRRNQTNTGQAVSQTRTTTMPTTASTTATAKKTTTAPDVAMKMDMPGWQSAVVSVKNSAERRFDLNRDGNLQAAETKKFLQDVVDQVDRRGATVVTSTILNDYDKNDDGVINRSEAELISKDLK
jgi:hypothetical protein